MRKGSLRPLGARKALRSPALSRRGPPLTGLPLLLALTRQEGSARPAPAPLPGASLSLLLLLWSCPLVPAAVVVTFLQLKILQ